MWHWKSFNEGSSTDRSADPAGSEGSEVGILGRRASWLPGAKIDLKVRLINRRRFAEQSQSPRI
jgi:hypothetical protein